MWALPGGFTASAKWGFTIANGRILTLPPDAVDPTVAGTNESDTASTTIQPVEGGQDDDGSADQAGPTAIGEGHLVYAVKVGEHWDLYRHNFANGKNRQLTKTPDNDVWAPAWAHDGETIASLSDAGGTAQVWLMDLFGRDQRQVTSYAGPGEVYYVAWSPDDSLLVVTVAEDFGARTLTMPAAGGALQEFLPVWSSFATFGPDWTMAYVAWANDDTDVLLANGNGAYLGDVSASVANEDAPNISAGGATSSTWT